MLLSISAFSQESFRVEWEIDDYARPKSAIKSSNGNTLIIGQINLQNNNDFDAFIFKMLPNGDYSYIRTSAPPDTSTIYRDIIQLNNGNFFVIGVNGASNYNNSDEQYKLVTAIFDENLNLISEKKYNYDYTYKSIGSVKILHEENGNILLAASAVRFSGSPSNYIDLGLFRFTPEGDTIETKFYHYERNVYIYDFKKIPESDNYLILEFTTQWYGDFECYVLKPDLTAECINYHSSYDYSVNEDLTLAYWYPDKSFMMGSSMSLSEKERDIGLGVFRCDTLANISDYLFLNHVDIYDQHAPSQCMSYADENSIYITGFVADYGNCENPDSIELYVVDTALNQVAYKSLGGDMSYEIFGVLTANDGGAIIYGSAINYKNDCSPNLVVYYVSRDELGLPPVKVFDIKKTDDQDLVYPNPACDIVNIRVKKKLLHNRSRIRLYNSFGKKIYDYRLPSIGNTLQLDVSNLDKGVYIYKIVNDESVISAGKFIKQ